MRIHIAFRSKLAQVVTATAASLGWMCSGAVVGYTSSAIPSMRDDEYAHKFSITNYDIAWIGGLVPVGAICGSLLGGPLLTAIGRQRCMLLITVPLYAAGWILISAATHLAMVYVGRFTGGLAMGLSYAAAPVLVMETTQVSVRGYLGSLPQVMVSLGVLISYLLGAALNWYYLGWATAAVTVLPYFLLLLLVPESPVWLLSHRGRQEALDALTWLRGGNVEVAELELRATEDNVTSAAGSFCKGPFASIKLLKQPPHLKTFLVVMGLVVFQQLTGTAAVLFYTVDIFQNAGMYLDAHLSAIVVGAIQFVAVVGGTSLVERSGRRPLLTISASFMALSMGILGGYLYKRQYPPTFPNWIPLLSLALFIVAHAIGYGPLTWLVSAELLPLDMRAVVMPIATAVNWGYFFLVTFTFQILVDAIHDYGVFWLYGSVALLGIPFTVLCVPETKGLTADEIRQIFDAKDRRECLESPT